MKNLKLTYHSMTSLLCAIFMAACLSLSPIQAQDDADDVVIEDTSTSMEETIDDSSEVYTESDE